MTMDMEPIIHRHNELAVNMFRGEQERSRELTEHLE
jgi:hypothetical protein